ncbi:PilZ domain-containing protein [Thaumasiovibrio subtropicus]|uniref:PilZ domain-containing protein n=1 Tax=Thaumasiovibrio subtropicus TaxID=1891207 RepID=UPI000B35C1C9|nr:PilZ domain-containing protein [Thaumasiovibrio subtropicus]
MSLDEHKDIIEKLIPLYDSDDYDEMVGFLMEGATPPTRLQVKMEINRLMAPCHKLIDLRGKVNGECREYQLHGLSHWLDDVAINTYHRRIKFYGNQYREGLYEELMNTRNNFRVMHQQGVDPNEPKQKSLSAADDTLVVNALRFGNYMSRSESRLFISTPVEIQLPLKQMVNGVTSDISPSGAKFKVPSAFNYGLGQTLTARYIELGERAGVRELLTGIKYRIIGVDKSDNDSFRWLRLKGLDTSEAVAKAIEYEKNNTQKVKKNTDDLAMQAKSKGYENCYLKQTSALPVYFADDQIRHVLLTAQNHPVWEYWHDERNQPVIHHLLNKTRMRALGKPGLKQATTLIYSFQHQQADKTYFYSAAMPELSLEQRRLFWLLGAKRESWRVFRLSVFPLNDDDHQRMDDVAPNLVEEHAKLSHVALVEDLTLEESKNDYLLVSKPSINAKELNVFVHGRDTISEELTRYFDPQPQRAENRYQFSTKVTFASKKTGKISTSTLDISAHGLNIGLTKPVPLNRGDVIPLTLDELTKKAPANVLTAVQYRVVRVAPDRKSIQVVCDDPDHKAVAYLDQLLTKNHSKLTQIEENISHKELLLVLYQVLLSRLKCVPFFADKQNHRLNLRTIGLNFPLLGFHKVLSVLSQHSGGNDRQYSMAALFKGKMKPVITDPMRPIDPPKPTVNELYLKIFKLGDRITDVECKLLSEFESTEERIKFIKTAQSNGTFYALRASALPMKGALTLLTSQYLTELAQHTLHRARAIESEFSSLVGCGEVTDITEEVLTRLSLNAV